MAPFACGGTAVRVRLPRLDGAARYHSGCGLDGGIRRHVPWCDAIRHHEIPLGGLDVLDQHVAHALQIDGRAPFSRIGEVLGVSDQTVARRYARLRRRGGVRVLGLTDPLRIGLTAVVRAGAVHAGRGGLGRRGAGPAHRHPLGEPDVGRHRDLLRRARRRCPTQADALLLQKLPRTPRVVQVTAHAMLHVFFGRPLSPLTRTGPLGRSRYGR